MYTFSITKTFTGAANLGLAGSPILLGYIPIKGYPISAITDATALGTSGAAMLKLGLETDNDAAVKADTLVSTLSSSVLNSTVTYTKATGNMRKIIGTVSVANITSGSMKLTVVFNIGV